MIKITHLYAFRTYSGCLEGLPERKESLDSIQRQLKTLWGERPTLIEEPNDDARLPNWAYCLLLDGPALEGGDGSQLVYVFFGEAPPFRSIDISDRIDEEKWRRHAKDYEV